MFNRLSLTIILRSLAILANMDGVGRRAFRGGA